MAAAPAAAPAAAQTWPIRFVIPTTGAMARAVATGAVPRGAGTCAASAQRLQASPTARATRTRRTTRAAGRARARTRARTPRRHRSRRRERPRSSQGRGPRGAAALARQTTLPLTLLMDYAPFAAVRYLTQTLPGEHEPFAVIPALCLTALVCNLFAQYSMDTLRTKFVETFRQRRRGFARPARAPLPPDARRRLRICQVTSRAETAGRLVTSPSPRRAPRVPDLGKSRNRPARRDRSAPDAHVKLRSRRR